MDGRRSAYDPDEIEEERRDRERRLKINNEFRRFTRKVQEQWDNSFASLKLEWDTPFRCTSHFSPHQDNSSFSASQCYHNLLMHDSASMHVTFPVQSCVPGAKVSA